MNFAFLFLIFLNIATPAFASKQGRSRVKIPYISPDTKGQPKGTVMLDISEDGNGELPFVEIHNGEAYFYKSPEEYRATTYSKKERELERAQSVSVNHFDFLGALVGNLRGRM